LHATAPFATLAAGKEDDDFGPTTSPEKSGKTRLKSRRSRPDRTSSIAVSAWLLIGYFIAIPCKRKVAVAGGKVPREQSTEEHEGETSCIYWFWARPAWSAAN
jgi:hypothetical protein